MTAVATNRIGSVSAARRGGWVWFLLIGGAFILLGQTLHQPTVANLIWLIAQMLGIWVIAQALISKRPRWAVGWLLIIASRGVCLALTAWATAGWMWDLRAPSSWAWAAGLAAQYAIFTVGLTMVIGGKGEHARAEATIDAAIVAIGLAIIGWTFLVEPSIVNQPPAHRLFGLAVCFAAIDLVMMIILVRAGLNARRLGLRGLLLALAGLLLLLADLVYVTRIAVIGTEPFPPGGMVHLAAQLAGILAAGAAMATPAAAAPLVTNRRRRRLGPARTGALVALATLAPLCLLVTADGPQRLQFRNDLPMLVAPAVLTSMLMALLVVRVAVGERLATRQAAALDAQTAILRQALADQEELQRVLAHRALHDPLTGLANRSQFDEHLAWRLSLEDSHPGALILIDLDEFKEVNDTFGHPAGDLVLIEVAQRLRQCVGADILARLGGDEFALILTGPPGSVEQQVNAALDAVQRPYPLSNQETVRLSASFGLFELNGSAVTNVEAIQAADRALYAAKAAGKNRVVKFHPGMQSPTLVVTPSPAHRP